MNRETSIYLDCVRFAAAFLVFLSHVGWQQNSGGLLWQLTWHGQEAVDVFFVLSGFVIAYSVDVRRGTAFDYGVARAARIYSVALPALFLTFTLDAIGRAYHPELYTGWCCDVGGSPWWQFFSSLVFVNEIWSHHVAPGSALPYWSLGYEVWYYVSFGIAVFAPRPWNLIGAALVMVAVGPGIAVLFPLWLLGLVCYRICARCPPGPRLGSVLFAAPLLALILYETEAYRYGEMYTAFALTPPRLHDYAQDYILGLLFAVHALGVRGISHHLAPALLRWERPIRWIAGATFSMYLFHQPLIHVLVALAPWPASTWATRALVMIATPVLVLVLAEVTERRRTAWRRAIAALLAPCQRRKVAQG